MTTHIEVSLLSKNNILSSVIKTQSNDNPTITKARDEYYMVKKRYYDFIKSYKPKNLMINDIDGISTNYPLRFFESKNKLILEIIDPVKRIPVYRKTIILEYGIHLTNEYSDLRKMLNQQKYTFDKLILFNKLRAIKEEKYLLEKLAEEEKITKDEYVLDLSKILVRKTHLEKTYTELKGNYNTLIEKLKLISKLSQKKYQDNLSLYNTQEISLMVYKLLVNRISEDLLKQSKGILNSKNLTTSESLVHYKFLQNLMFNTNISLGKNNLVVNKSEYEKEGNVLKINYIHIVESVGKDTLLCRDIADNKKEINKKDVFVIKSISNLVDNLYIDLGCNIKNISVDANTSLDNGYQIYSYVQGSIESDNIDNKVNYINATVQYFNSVTKPSSQKIRIRKKVSKAKNITIFTNDYTKDIPLNVGNIFLVGMYTLYKPYPGKGLREKIDTISLDSKAFDELVKVKNWRKILSNNYIHRSSNLLIRPIIIDSNSFASVEHYILYSKYLVDINGNFSNNFKFGGKFGKLNPLTLNGKDYSVVDNWVEKEKELLEKANFSKFTQLVELTPALMLTNEALLVFQDTKSESMNNYKYANSLMIARNLIAASAIPENYNNAGEDMSLASSFVQVETVSKLTYDTASKNDLTKSLASLKTELNSGPSTKSLESLASLKTELNSGPSTKSLESPASLKTELNSSQSPNSDDSFASFKTDDDDSNTPTNPTESFSSSAHNLSIQQKIAQQLESSKQILKKVEYGETKLNKMTADEIVDLAVKIQSLDDEYFSAAKDLKNKIAVDYPNHTLVEVPPDGDCLYYAIIQLLHLYNIFPMNFDDGDEDGQFSTKTLELLLVAGNTSKRGPIYREASLQLRKIVSDKLKSNLEVDSEEIRTIKVSMEDTSDYLNGIEISASPINTGTKGMWGGDLELRLISAIFNITFIVVFSDENKIVYKPSVNRLLFPLGIALNNSAKDLEIHLGYLLGGNHYLGIVESVKNISGVKLLEEMSVYENIPEYYYKSIDVEGVVYLLAYILSNDTNIEPRGFYNMTTHKIKYEEDLVPDSDEDVSYGNIVDSLDNIDVESLTNIQYLKNLEDNMVYVEVGDNKIKVGELIDDELQEGEYVPSKIIKFD